MMKRYPKQNTASLLRLLAELKAMVDPQLHISQIQTTITFIGRDGSGEQVRLTTRERFTRNDESFDQCQSIMVNSIMEEIEGLERELNNLKTKSNEQ